MNAHEGFSPAPYATASKSVSPDLELRARRIESEIIRRLASVGQVAIADHVGVDESTVSRLKGDTRFGIRQFAEMLALLGLKAVPVDMQCYRPQDIEPYIQLAKQHMARMRGAEDLLFEDDPE